MIYEIYKKQVEAWKERFDARFYGKPKELPLNVEDLLLSRHKDTIELIEAEIERKKGLRKEIDHEFWSRQINREGMRLQEGYNSCLDEDIAYLEEQLKLIKKEQ